MSSLGTLGSLASERPLQEGETDLLNNAIQLEPELSGEWGLNPAKIAKVALHNPIIATTLFISLTKHNVDAE